MSYLTRVTFRSGSVSGLNTTAARSMRDGGALAQNIGVNLLLLDQEIQKLLLYVGEDVPITAEDVNVMVPYIQSADVIFQMVDALGQRDARLAASHLHRLLDVGEHPLGIFGMIVRQFRPVSPGALDE